MEKKYIQSIVRACNILDYIAKNKKVRLNELTKEFGLAKTTIHGILSTLEYQNLIYKDENSNYYLGIKTYTYGKAYEKDFNLIKIIHPYLEELVSKYNETVHMAIEDKNKVLYIDRISSSHAIRSVSEIGGTDPLYCSAIGKIILSEKTTEQVDEYLDSENLVKRTANTIVNKQKIKEELINIKNDSFSVDYEELETGLICTAAGIYSNSVLSAVISISGLQSRIDDKTFEMMKKDIRDICKQLSALI